MKYYTILLLFGAACFNACAQNRGKTAKNSPSPQDIRVGGGCEGCEAIYESPVAFSHLNAVDTLPDFNDKGPKLELSGTIFQKDGKTPAAGVVLYIYHTDQAGIYPRKGDEKGWARRHGYIRGWIRTGADGKYKFYTLIPASYPNSNNPKHIHPTIKEEGKSEYWIGEFLFADDPLLPGDAHDASKERGGNGILTLTKDGDTYKAVRNIYLGRNIPGYPG